MRSDLGVDCFGPSNEDRALWAYQALEVFCLETGLNFEDEKESAVSDLLCNLGHYCDLHRLDFIALLSGAVGVWDAEKREEAEGAPNSLAQERVVTIVIAPEIDSEI
jgi:hypothetical protein